VVSRTVRSNSLCGLLIAKSQDGVASSAEFERTDFLQIFAFEKQVSSSDFVQ